MATEGGPAPASPLFDGARRLVSGADRASFWLVVAAMAGMAGLVSFQVFMRYALSSSLDWAEEIARLFFVWTMLLAIPHGIKVGVHVGIDLLVLQFPPRLQEVLFRAMALIGSLLMLLVCAYAYVVVEQTWQELMPTVNVTSAVYYIAVLISAGHSCLHLALLSWGGSQTWAEEARPVT